MTTAQKQILLALPLSDVKKAAWKLFSEYIRKRDVEEDGFGNCRSCGKNLHWKQGQAGHWPEIAGRSNSVLFAEKGVHLQCGQCNVYKDGNPAGYTPFMEKTYGRKVMEDLRKLKRKTVKYEKQDYFKMMDKWELALKSIDVV